VGSLFSALNSASSALVAFQQAVDTTQNNVTNANSPGYADQVPEFQARDFQSADGLSGGVVELNQDTRNQFADTAVQQQLSLQGLYQQLQTSLTPLQNVFDVSSTSSIPTAFNQLFQSFSQWSTQPNNAVYQTAVINAAQQTATAFQQAAAELSSIRGSSVQDLQSTVAQINQDAAQIQSYNASVGQQNGPDPGAQAQLESTLENLSGLANVQAIGGIGNTVTVLLGGQTPLVVGTQVNALQVQPDATNALNGPPNQSIVDSNGNDVTSQVTSGSLAGLLTAVNQVIPSLAGGGQQVGGLNTLAQGVADAVNNLLAQGSTTATPPYQTGVPLFTYTAGAPAGVAASINVNPAMTPSQLAAADPGPPPVSNGIALQLSQLDSGSGGPINGLGPTQYFGTLVSQVGNAVSNAGTSATAQTQLVAQAKSLQQQLSGVNLDEEAVRLVQLQSSYQAASKVVTVIDELTQSLISMVE
jgi:flagellar hook-associated protein 1 FlgK